MGLLHIVRGSKTDTSEKAVIRVTVEILQTGVWYTVHPESIHSTSPVPHCVMFLISKYFKWIFHLEVLHTIILHDDKLTKCLLKILAK